MQYVAIVRADVKKELLQDKFNESKREILLPIFVNALFALFYLLFDPANPLLWYSLSSSLSLLLLYLVYNWKDLFMNGSIALLYLLIFIAEWYFHGIPGQAIEPEDNMGKGIFMDILLAIIPYLYIGLRLLLVLPIIGVTWYAHKLNKRRTKT
jgi:hypothetical protein